MLHLTYLACVDIYNCRLTSQKKTEKRHYLQGNHHYCLLFTVNPQLWIPLQHGHPVMTDRN